MRGFSAERSRLAALEGADVLINFTNDGWLGLRQAPYQHLYMTLARSVETGLPLIRAANSGFSAVISAKGGISGPAPFSRKGLSQRLAWLAEIPISGKKNRTVFVSRGASRQSMAFVAFAGGAGFAAAADIRPAPENHQSCRTSKKRQTLT